MLSEGFVGKSIESTGRGIGFDLAIPKIIVELQEPPPERCEFVR